MGLERSEEDGKKKRKAAHSRFVVGSIDSVAKRDRNERWARTERERSLGPKVGQGRKTQR